MAAEAWTSLITQYRVMNNLALVNTQRDLHTTMFKDGDDLEAHIANLHTKWAKANSMGAKINDVDFRMVILSSLPASWDSLVAMLYTSTSSTKVITCLMMHWSRVGRSKMTLSPNTTTTALQANAKQGNRGRNSNLKCDNCSHCGHEKPDCYWEGGGKEGQFPPGFGKRGGAKGSTNLSSQHPPTMQGETTANIAVVDTSAYVCMAIVSPDEDLAPHYMVSTIPDKDSVEAEFFEPMALMSDVGGTNLVTYGDSGASDHCFANKINFSSYESFAQP